MDKYELAALKFANRIRQAQRRKLLKRLPKGVMGDENSCPIANAINNGLQFSVNADETTFEFIPKIVIPEAVAGLIKMGTHEEIDEPEPIEVGIPMPKLADQFVERFDLGKYPALVAKEPRK